MNKKGSVSMAINWEQLKEVPITNEIFELLIEVNKGYVDRCAKGLGLNGDELKNIIHAEYFIPGMTLEVAAESLKMFISSQELGYQFPTPVAAIRDGITCATIALSCPRRIAELAASNPE